MPKLALSPVREPNSPILIVSCENPEPATARTTPKTRRNRRFIIGAELLAFSQKTARAFGGGILRLSFTVRRSPFIVQGATFSVQRSAGGVRRSPVFGYNFTAVRSSMDVILQTHLCIPS